MIKYLKDLECINLERLLLLRGKELSLTDEECHILLLIDTFVTLHKKMITPSLLLKYSSLTPHEMDHILDSLLKKKWIFNKNGAICLNHFEEKLLEKMTISMDKEEAITKECQIKKETDYYYYGEGNTVQVMVALLISVISALIMLGLYIFGFTYNGVMLSQFRDLMCTSIGFLLGEAKIKSKN